MKQSFAKEAIRDSSVLATPSVLLILVMDAAVDSGGPVPRGPWGLRAAAEAMEAALPADGPMLFASVHAPVRGITNAALLPMVETLIETGFLSPFGVGRLACWQVPRERRPDVDALWEGVSPSVATAARSAGQRVAAITVALSKTPRAATDSSAGTSTS